ncbi:MAG: hypothetical protein Q8O14_04040 [bacterium]|jgi:tetratricopeptide (TPR) repeat protein|nr:hypothetical protein [bacterium]
MRCLVLLMTGLLMCGAPIRAVETDPRLTSLRDSLALGIDRLQEAWQRTERAQTDSLKQRIQGGPALAWKDWAFNRAPRRGMSGDDIIQLAELHSWLNRFDMEGCYNEQLECYKRAMLMPGTEARALRRLHAEYHAAGFAPGVIQTGLSLHQLDRRKSLEQGVGRNLAQAYLMVGDRREALRWIKRHLRQHAGDDAARDLKRRIRNMKKQPS